MSISCSLDYGTVSVDVTHDRQCLLARSILAFSTSSNPNSSLQSNIPRTLYGARNQVAAIARMLYNLSGKDETLLGGFRIEITVKARWLQETAARIKRTFWIHHIALIMDLALMRGRQ